MDWLVTYKYDNVERHLKLHAHTIPSIQVIAFRALMEVFGEKPPVEKVPGQPVLEWMRACGVDIVDVILLRRISRGVAEGKEAQGVSNE